MTVPGMRSVRDHAVVFWLMRGTGMILAGVAGLLLVGMTLAMGEVLLGTKPDWWPLFLLMIPTAIVVLMFLAGYQMWRRLDPSTVANFSFIFAVLLARALYFLMPPVLPAFVADALGHARPFTEPEFDYRFLLAILTFLVGYRVLKSYLIRLFGLDVPAPGR